MKIRVALLLSLCLTLTACRRGEHPKTQTNDTVARHADRTNSRDVRAASTGPERRGPGPSVERIRKLSRGIEPGRQLTPESWPSGARAALALTFDFDAELAYHGFDRKESSPGSLAPSLSHGTFGVRRGLPRILEMLEELEVRASFLVPGAMTRLHPDALQTILERGHDLELHGWTHTDLEAVRSRKLERRGLNHGLEALRSLGADPTGFRAPYGRLSPHTLSLLREVGLGWDATLHGDDFHPYELVLDGKRSGLIELPQVPYANDWALFGRPGRVGPEARPSAVRELWFGALDAAYQEGGVFTLTCHPQVIGHPERLELVRALVERAKAKEEPVWIAPAGEIVSYVRDRFDL